MSDLTDNELTDDEYLLHYGTPRHSGRYPWGSGEDPFQNSSDFLSRVDELSKAGMSRTQIAESLGLETGQKIKSGRLRSLETIAKNIRRKDLYSKVVTLKEEGLSNVAIADKLGLPGESSVRSLLNAQSKARMAIAEDLTNTLRDLVDERGMIDIGAGVPRQLNVSKEKMDVAIEMLKNEGYVIHGNRVPQVTNIGQLTTLKVLCPPGTPSSAIYDYGKIRSVYDVTSFDDGKTLKPAFQYPASLDLDRVSVRYAEDGGTAKDGVIELRRGVDDISLGTSNYSQVRILVNGTHYLKGMAVYSDKMPDGVDVIFNTNKNKSVAKIDTMKKIKDDPINPFGSTIKENGGQSTWVDSDGVERLTVINKRSDEGDWGNWSKEISAQFLAKQPQKLIDRQIDISIKEKFNEYEEIMALTNPTIKRALLESFADDCDAAAVSLKAAGLPGAVYKVILPVTSLKDGEVYAPHLEDGSTVALVRYPHGGKFEIPTLTVNNRNKEAIDIMTKNATDAIGINARVADIMSGADFDGDTVMVIPTNDRIKIKAEKPLSQLEGFDTILNYGPDESHTDDDGNERYYRGGKEFKILSDTNTQNQMGIVSNLITDMTLMGAPNKELARAVKHSMVIIDANKHHLDYKQSEADNGIKALHKKYQTQMGANGKTHLGAATLISKSKSKFQVGERKLGKYVHKDTLAELTIFDAENKIYLDEKTGDFFTEKEKRTIYIDRKTGEKLYTYTNREYMQALYKDTGGKTKKSSVVVKDNKLFYKGQDGQYKEVTDEAIKTTRAVTNSKKMYETNDAHTLSSGTPQEEAYANYANQLKTLGNLSRLATLTITDNRMSKSARAAYDEEYHSLVFKINQALLNAPRERQAQTMAASIVKLRKQENPRMTQEEERKIRQQEISRARTKAGASRAIIKITQEEWNAIQAGAISTHRLKQIMANADMKVLRQFAMPRTRMVLSPAKIRRIENMSRSGHTTAEIAQALGVSASTITKTLRGE